MKTPLLGAVLLAFSAPIVSAQPAFLLKDVRTGFDDSSVPFGNDFFLTDLDGTLFFVADEGFPSGEELWTSDGTTGGTRLVRDIRFGSFDSRPRELAAVGNILFFAADDGATGDNLWKSDGTELGTVIVKEIRPGGSAALSGLTDVNGTLFFSANDGIHGSELWKSNGTAAGTVMVKDIRSGSGSAPVALYNANGTLYFTARTEAQGREIWKSDGTAEGTVMVADIHPGSADTEPGNFAHFGDTVYFGTDLRTTTQRLWKTDGTPEGTILLKAFDVFSPFAQLLYLRNLDGTLFFRANDGVHGSEIWKSDGTPAGTVLVKDIDPSFGSEPVFLTPMNGLLYFRAEDSVHGVELWRSDGTETGTVMVKDIREGSLGSLPENFVAINGTLFFRARTPETGIEIWKSNGTEAGTVLVQDINIGTESSTQEFPRIGGDFPIASGSNVFFAADDGSHGREVWALPFGRPELVEPEPETNLTGSSVTFSWRTNGTPVTNAWLYVGTEPGQSDLLRHRFGGQSFHTMDPVPTDGSEIFARLWFRIDNTWDFEDYRFTTDDTGGTPALVSPSNGATLAGASSTFTWQPNGSLVEDWWLYVGTWLGGSDLHGGFSLGPDARSAEVSGLPTDGSPVHLRLWFRRGREWGFEDYSFLAPNFDGSPTLVGPPSSLPLPGSTVTFRWQPNGSIVSSWWLYVGTSLGGSDLHGGFSLGPDAGFAEVSGLPTDGSPVHLRLWFRRGREWGFEDYSFVASNLDGPPTLVSPPSSLPLPGSTVTFSWQPNGSVVSSWWLYVGTSPGGSELHDSHNLGAQLSTEVSHLPTNGSQIFVRLWYRVGFEWRFVDAVFTAASP